MKADYTNKKILGMQYPILGLSPMDGVTDSAYRQIVKKYGNTDLLITEFTNVMGMILAPEKVLEKFYYEEMERPIVGQIYGNDPEYFYHAAKIITALGFDAVDINMGCPSKSVSGSGSGAGLIRTPDLAREIVEKVKLGLIDWVNDGKLTGLKPGHEKYVLELIAKNRSRIDCEIEINEETSKGIINLINKNRVLIPVSVKTRIGYETPITEDWISNLNKVKPDWIYVHGRTLKQLYRGLADWNELKKAVEIAESPVFVNGDVTDYAGALKILDYTGAIGVLIGRGSWGNPWAFNKNTCEITQEEKLKVLLEHAELFDSLNKNNEGAFVQMRKNFGWYIKGFENAKDLRIKLMKVKNLQELKIIITEAIS